MGTARSGRSGVSTSIFCGVLQTSNALLAPLRALVQEPQRRAGEHSPEGIPAQGTAPLRRETEGEVKPATANRDIAAISKLFSYALECAEVDKHPLVRFPKLKEPKKVFRPLTVKQFRDLVEAVDNPYLRAMIAVIGETGIRKGEALSLTWSRVDRGRRLMWVEFTKDDEPREIPLQPVADAGGGRENGPEADGPLGDQHDHALCRVRQFACAAEHSGGTGSRRLANAIGSIQSTGRKQGEMIRAEKCINYL